MNKVIALLTDFGTESPYLAMMKAVIVGINPRIRLLDIAHDISAHNIRQASFVLAVSFKYFPEGTIFLVVVDPGVGSSRKAIAIKTRHFYFVGPDNGVLYEAARRDGIRQVRKLENKRYCLAEVSSTFQGRDIFAPFAAHLSCGVAFSDLGSVQNKITMAGIATPVFTKAFVKAEIIYIDHFGNLITNIDNSTAILLQRRKAIAWLNRKKIQRYFSCYAEAKTGEPFFIQASLGYLEIALKQDSAQHFFQAEVGDKLRCEFTKS